MLGAITGDIVGSVYEHANIKTKNFPFFQDHCAFTDDTVCTVAIADALNSGSTDFTKHLRNWVQKYPTRGYGRTFQRWGLSSTMKPYGSWGNGAAMRVSPVAHVARDEQEALDLAEQTAVVSHNHPDAVTGAQATVLTMWMAKARVPAADIRQEMEDRFGYDLSQSVDEIRPWYKFDIRCSGTVPPAIVCALEATDYEDAVRNAISIGGDSDTLACITGGIAEVMFGVPEKIAEKARSYLGDDLLGVVDRFIVG